MFFLFSNKYKSKPELSLYENDDYGEMPDECHDSFGEISLIGQCEPEDAIWRRDLQENYYTGLEVGIRNTLKVLKDNPELLEQLKS